MSPLIELRDVAVTFGGAPLFAGIDLHVVRGDRLALVGRNGSGKTTMLKLLAGLVEPDRGRRSLAAGVQIGMLAQDVDFGRARTLADYLATPALAGSQQPPRHEIEASLAALGLSPDQPFANLSGGETRRAALANALVGKPDLLLLDEPTNHLDLTAIIWLEHTLAAYPGAIVMISHDRSLLRRVATNVVWLDRGQSHRLQAGFDQFDGWMEGIIAEQVRAEHQRDRKLARELAWLHKGVTARRRRNQGRLRSLQALRRERQATWPRRGSAKLSLAAAPPSGDVAIEAEAITKWFGDKAVVKPFSIRVMRGDRIALIGPNGAGKTTLVRLLVGDMSPDTGRVRHGTRLQTAYFDQRREALDEAQTPWAFLCPRGGDHVEVRGRSRHVIGYLRDFLFDEAQARMPIEALSGGERSRLLLAQLFARPANLLVLDEPTNDLDMETLDLLQEVIAGFDGTVLVVSHDRDFIDGFATSTIVLSEDGRAESFVGGFTDLPAAVRPGGPAAKPDVAPNPGKKARKGPRPRTRLSYKEQRELDALPALIEAHQGHIRDLEAQLSDPDLFARDGDCFAAVTASLAARRAALDAAEARWLDLEEKREQLADAAKADVSR